MNSPNYRIKSLWIDLLKRAHDEDGGIWDWSSLGLSTPDLSSRMVAARVIAKSKGIWAGEGLADSISELSHSLQIRSDLANGDPFSAGDRVSEWKGPFIEVLAWERPYLNLASFASGISTATNQFVQKVQKALPERPPRITLTRKTLPGYRDISIEAVRSGGGFPHRVSLSGGVLLKENHIAVAGSITKAIQQAQAVAPHSLRIEVEVRSLEEFEEALKTRAEVIMLDNFTPDQVRRAMTLMSSRSPRPLIEVSGGLTLDTIEEYSIEGVDVLSVGALTHSVRASDFSLLIEGL